MTPLQRLETYDQSAIPSRRELLRQAGLGMTALVTLVNSEFAWGATILAVRMWPAADYTRVTIESDTALSARQFLTAEGTDRLVVDIDNLELDSALRELVGKVRGEDPFVAGIRVGQFRPGVVRIVLDLKQPVAPQQFALPPVAPYRHRLVLDLFPLVAPDPLWSLVKAQESSRQAPGSAALDHLGDFITRIERRSGPTAVNVSPARDIARVPPLPAMASRPAEPASAGIGAAPVASAPAEPSSAARPPSAASPRESLQSRVDRLVIVAIDPGHGGEDPGAIGPTGLREKDVVLQIALQLRDRLEGIRGMGVMLTRDGDYFVPLHERVRKARRVQADLFVSIHADAFVRPEARGASVFALSSSGASSATARWMANRENAADVVGGVNVAVQDKTILHTLLDMSTSAQIKDSLKLGREVLGPMGRVGPLHKPQVEQAGFAVLKAPDIPSILVETAFISNPQEEARLRTGEFRQQVVEALAMGIRRYFDRHPPLARYRPL